MIFVNFPHKFCFKINELLKCKKELKEVYINKEESRKENYNFK